MGKLANISHILFMFALFSKSIENSGLGRCPKYVPVPEFNITRFTGRWYEVERSFYFMELASSCTSLDITLSERGNLVVNVSTINKWTNRTSISLGTGIPSFIGSSIFRYKLNNRLPYAISRMLPGSGIYNVLYTDYENFAVLYSCSSVTIAYTDQLWLFGRKREINADLRAHVYHHLQDINMDPDRLIISTNLDCPSYNT